MALPKGRRGRARGRGQWQGHSQLWRGRGEMRGGCYLPHVDDPNWAETDEECEVKFDENGFPILAPEGNDDEENSTEFVT